MYPGSWMGCRMIDRASEYSVNWIWRTNRWLESQFLGLLNSGQGKNDYRALHRRIAKVLEMGNGEEWLCTDRQSQCSGLTHGWEALSSAWFLSTHYLTPTPPPAQDMQNASPLFLLLSCCDSQKKESLVVPDSEDIWSDWCWHVSMLLLENAWGSTWKVN